MNGTNGANHAVYNNGGADVVVTITDTNDLVEIDLGVWESVMNFLTGCGNNFELSMAKLYDVMFESKDDC